MSSSSSDALSSSGDQSDDDYDDDDDGDEDDDDDDDEDDDEDVGDDDHRQFPRDQHCKPIHLLLYQFLQIFSFSDCCIELHLLPDLSEILEAFPQHRPFLVCPF